MVEKLVSMGFRLEPVPVFRVESTHRKASVPFEKIDAFLRRYGLYCEYSLWVISEADRLLTEFRRKKGLAFFMGYSSTSKLKVFLRGVMHDRHVSQKL